MLRFSLEIFYLMKIMNFIIEKCTLVEGILLRENQTLEAKNQTLEVKNQTLEVKNQTLKVKTNIGRDNLVGIIDIEQLDAVSEISKKQIQILYKELGKKNILEDLMWSRQLM
ncbi:hypothetical protein CIY_22730 [Butyrivibrio fibrisolvens 16/4]|nr:hypothetical protein CIY_22730 [Butyrivibrio fibrisolvens 16/4]